MSFDDAAVRDVFDKLMSHAMTLGLFETVNSHEPKGAPGNGLWCALWVQRIAPVRSSGMAATSGRLELMCRIGSNFLAKPEDGIDPAILAAVSTLIGEYSGAFTLGGSARAIDLLGMEGTPLSAQAGYLDVSGKFFRIMDIVIPVIVNDMWQQGA